MGCPKSPTPRPQPSRWTPSPTSTRAKAVTLNAAVAGGTYDTIAYQWTLAGSVIAFGNNQSWTPADVSADTLRTVTCTVTARGNGTTAADGTLDFGNDTESFTVRDVPDLTAPATPAAPTIEVLSSHSLGVAWVAPDDGGSAITGYTLRWRVNGSGDAYSTVTTALLSRALGGILEGTEYEVNVRATNAEGNSSYSPSATATTATEPTEHHEQTFPTRRAGIRHRGADDF